MIKFYLSSVQHKKKRRFMISSYGEIMRYKTLRQKQCQIWLRQKDQAVGSCCGSVGRVVDSDTRYPRFESRYQQIIFNDHLYKICDEKTKIKKKEAESCSFFKKKKVPDFSSFQISRDLEWERETTTTTSLVSHTWAKFIEWGCAIELVLSFGSNLYNFPELWSKFVAVYAIFNLQDQIEF